MNNTVRVGVGVIILRGDRVLLGKRQGSHGEGYWGFPGGHLDFMEDVETCAARETFEETGLTITDIQRGPYTNDHFGDEGPHYVTLYVTATAPEGEPERKEPAKCEAWGWFPWDALPSPLFKPIENLLATGYAPV